MVQRQYPARAGRAAGLGTHGGGYDARGTLIRGALPSKAECSESPEYDGHAAHRFGEYPNSYFFYLPRLCNHCTNPPCVEACPERAMYRRDDFGLVLRDEERCRGQQECARACPYKKIYFNTALRISSHCIGCFPRLEKGVAPACVRQCPGRAVFIDYADEEEGAIYQLVQRWRVALPLRAGFHTGPNVFYVPPLSPHPLHEDGPIDETQRRIPIGYLEELFGSEVKPALDRLESEMRGRRQGNPSELLDLLIGRRWSDILGPFDRDPAEIVWE